MTNKIDWSNSVTSPMELWKNPLFSPEYNLQIADGAVAFEREVINNLRHQIDILGNFAKECTLDAYKETELRDAAILALSRSYKKMN